MRNVMPFRRFNISLPEYVVTEMDKVAKNQSVSRSGFIRRLIEEELTRLEQTVAVQPRATSDEDLERAYQDLLKERRRRRAGKDLKEMRRLLQAGKLDYDD